MNALRPHISGGPRQAVADLSSQHHRPRLHQEISVNFAEDDFGDHPAQAILLQYVSCATLPRIRIVILFRCHRDRRNCHPSHSSVELSRSTPLPDVHQPFRQRRARRIATPGKRQRRIVVFVAV